MIEQLKERGWILCGSRYFGDETPESDWDYFRSHDRLEQAWLTQNGFTLRERDYRGPLDSNTVSIFERENIHAIFVRSEAMRTVAQEIARQLDKKERKQTPVWNALYAAITHLTK